MGSKKNGLLALLSIGALAYWKYKKSTPEQKQKIKDTIDTAKDNLCKFGNDLKSKANDVVDQAKNKAEDVKGELKEATK